MKVTKEKIAKFIPNAVGVYTESDKVRYFFYFYFPSSFDPRQLIVRSNLGDIKTSICFSTIVFDFERETMGNCFSYRRRQRKSVTVFYSILDC